MEQTHIEQAQQLLRTRADRAQQLLGNHPEPERTILRPLAVQGALVEASRKTHNFAYRSYEHLVLTAGEVWRAPLDAVALDYPVLTERECFGNALSLALDEELTYAEGYARTELGIWVQHAWNVTAEGVVVDATWGYRLRDHGSAMYAGLRFALDYVLERTGRTGRLGVLVNDWRMDVGILREGLGFTPEGLVVEGP